MGSLQSSLDHIKNHTEYPTTSQALMAACNNMSDVAGEDKEWFGKTLPEGTYGTPEDVVKAVLAKV